MRPIIKVENLSKQYHIGAHQAPYMTLRETLTDAVKSPLKRFSRNDHTEENTIWALKDINFEVFPGEVVGIIGRNGAGKSTLLKVLSRITEPTSGQVDLYGRVGSLLEVGTGFHMELTGRENIFLNGAILGMRNTEIRRRFDEIVDFAGIEKFLDTPVKHYSSGMFMRLAFSVAAHLDPEILIIDEVLAVGDAEFQKKCLGKIKDISSNEHKTVLFVSHNMTAISNFCISCIYLQQGKLVNIGSTTSVVKDYLNSDLGSEQMKRWDSSIAPGNKDAILLSCGLNLDDNREKAIYEGEAINLLFEFELLPDNVAQYDITFHLVDELENLIFVGSTVFSDEVIGKTGKGVYKASCIIPRNLMMEGRYKISRLLFVKDKGTVVCEIKDIFSFDVLPGKKEMYGWQGKKEGIIRPYLQWQFEYSRQYNNSNYSRA